MVLTMSNVNFIEVIGVKKIQEILRNIRLRHKVLNKILVNHNIYSPVENLMSHIF